MLSRKPSFFSKWISSVFALMIAVGTASFLSQLRQEGSLSTTFAKWGCRTWEGALTVVLASIACGAAAAWTLMWIERWEERRSQRKKVS